MGISSIITLYFIWKQRNSSLVKHNKQIRFKETVQTLIKQKMQKLNSRLNWTIEQQEYLRTLKEIRGITSWTVISNEINRAFQGKNRSGKQCRERYMNYVRFNDCEENNSKWTANEDQILFDNFLVYGRKWVQICKEMRGKSENCLKNRFYGAMRKITRRITKAFKELKIKAKKNIRQDIFIKILETPADCIPASLKEDGNELLIRLKNDLIRLAISPEESLVHEQVAEIVERVHSINGFLKTNQSQLRMEKEQKIQMEPLEMKLNKELSRSTSDSEMKINIVAPLDSPFSERPSEEEMEAMRKEEQTYLLDLGFDLENVNGSICYNLEKEVSEILDLEFVETIPEIF